MRRISPTLRDPTQPVTPASLSGHFRADGERLRHAILERWTDGEPVEVDFENESIASLSFLDEAIAVLFLDRSREEILSHLRTANMVPGDRDLLNRQVGQRIREASKLQKSG